MPKVFISYRREDSAGHAGRLHDRLAAAFGRDRIFMDVDAIDVGADFVARINEAVGECDALIAVIGDEWLGEEGRRRIDDPADFVRLEIAAALERDIRVIPALVSGAKPPTAAQLPEPLKKLANRHAIELSDTRWDYDTGRLVELLRDLDDDDQAPQAAGRRAGAWIGTHRGAMAAVLAALVAGAVGVALLAGGGDDGDGSGEAASAPDENALTALVAASIAPTCSDLEPPNGGEAAVVCEVPGADYLNLESFPAGRPWALERQEWLGGLKAAKQPCSATDWNQTLPWKNASVPADAPPVGQLVCYTADGEAIMAWTHDEDRVVAWIGRLDGDRGALVRAWGEATAY